MTNQQMQTRLNEIIANIREKYHVPSIMVSVHKDGETFFCGGGTANVETGLQANENTIYAIASSSKAFIATALCILCDEGKLELDKPVKTYMPDFEMYDPYMTEHLTIRDALGHRSGMPRHDLSWLNNEEMTIYDVVQRIRYLPPSFEPRSRMYYQNHMFALACVLCERITGVKWYEFVTERILKPIGMTRTFPLAEDFRGKDDNCAEPYRWDKELEHMKFNDISRMGACGCISSTVHDLDLWSRLHLGRGEVNGVRIYSEKMADQMHCPQMIIKPGEMFPYDFDEIDFTNYGQGWFIECYRGFKLVHHGGTIDGFKSLVGFLPKNGVSFSVLTNLNRNQSPTALGYIIADLALDLEEIDWTQRFWDFMEQTRVAGDTQGEQMEEAIRNAKPQGHANEDYVGAYFHPGYGDLTVFEKDGQLYTHFLKVDIPLRSGGLDLFYADGRKVGAGYGVIPVRFDYDLSGKIISVSAPLEDMGELIVFKKQ